MPDHHDAGQMTDGAAAGASNDAPDLGRRAWLLRLGLFAVAAYAAPSVLQIGDSAEAQGRRRRSRSDSDRRRRRGRRRRSSDSDRRRRRRRHDRRSSRFIFG